MMQRMLTAVGIWLGIANSYATVWTDCSEAFEPIAQNVVLPGPAEIDYKVGLGKEFREALADRKDINWNAVADNYREWSEHTTTLSGPARMLVACVLTVVTNGMGSEWFASHGIAEGTATHAALSAGIQAVVVGAGTSFAGNLGDIGKTFDELTSEDFVKNIASTMLTAGISQSLSTSLNLPKDPKNFTEALKSNAVHGLVRTGVDSAINGGKVGKNLAQTLTTAAVDAGSAKIANKIGDGKHSGALNPITHKAAHGALAVASAKLTGRDALAGAIGAAASETAAEAMDKPGASPEERQKIAQKARLIGDTVAFLSGRDVASADSAGKTAVDNNFLGEHLTEIDAQRALMKLLPEEIAAEGQKRLDLDEQVTIEAMKNPIVNTIAVGVAGMGVPLVAQTAGVLGTTATAHYFGSIAVDSGAKGLVKEAKDHPIMTTLAVMPFVPKGLKGVQSTTKTLVRTEQAVQQEFRFVQELQPAKKIETVVDTGKRWSKTTEFKGTTIHQRDEFIDPMKKVVVRENGKYVQKTNYELMKAGKAPIGPDGKAIELHHVLQTPDGPLVEITNQLHTKYKKQLHINPDSWGSAINRPVFDDFRGKYWQERAKDFEEVVKNVGKL